MNFKFLLALSLLFSSLAVHAGGIGSIFRNFLGDIAGKAITSQMIERSLKQTADIVNKQLPANIDKDVRYDSVSAGPGRRFTHYYTFVNAPASNFDKSIFYQDSFPKLRNLICTSPDTQDLVKNDVVVSFSYRGNDGLTVSTIDITPRDCR